MEEIKIIDLLSEKIPGEWGEEDSLSGTAVNVIRTANFTNSGIISFNDIVKREVDRYKVMKKHLQDGDIIIEKSGGSPSQPVGRVVYFQNPNEEIYLCNTFTTALRPDKTKISPKYFFYLLQNNYATKKVLEFQNKTTGIINLKLDRYLESKINYNPDFETQNKIVAILDKAKTILDKREKTVQIYDELLQAIFLKMFGDPLLNPKGWETESLLKLGEFKNGLNYKKEETGHRVLCLGVGDFKSNWEINNMNNLSTISLKKLPLDDYFLKDNDLVFVRSNGNKRLVGRCVVVRPGKEKVTFSGFCIRYRLNDEAVSSIFLVHLLRVPVFKNALLQNGRGANIQNINQQLLGNLKIPVPPKYLQLEFEKQVDQLQRSLKKVEIFRSKSEDLLNSLSQQVFSERITIDIDAELEALIDAINLDRKDEENRIDTVKKDITFIKRLIDKMQEQDFDSSDQYEKAKYITFRIMKEHPDLIKQNFNPVYKKIVLEL